MTLRDQIIESQQDRKPVALEVPEWGCTVWMRQLTVADQVALSEGTKPAEMPVQVFLHALVDDAGERIFADDDAAALESESFAIVLRVFSEVARLNGLSTAELDEAMQSFDRARREQRSTDSRSLSGETSLRSVHSQPVS